MEINSYKNNGKTTTYRDNDDNNLIKPQSSNNSVVKKEIFFIGDSRIKCVNGRGFSGNNSMKVKSHPGATTDDFIDYV